MRGLHASNLPANIVLNLVHMPVELWEFQTCITEQNDIDRHAFLQQAEQHGGRIFSTGK